MDSHGMRPSSRTGTWEVDRKRYPRGLREISDFVRSRGCKSTLWFEPERVFQGTWIAENRPEWVHGGKEGGLLELGNPACRPWITDTIDRLITEEGIDVYRQDFNLSPLGFWRAADAEDRQGITEIRHVEGYLALWDELLRRHPGLLIDSCASGGRRNDIESLRRAVPLLRSDWYHGADGQQCHTYGLSLWLPYQGTGAIYGKHMDAYWLRSSMVAEFTFGPDAAGMAAADLPLLKRMVDGFHRIADCFLNDFYPLTPYTQAGDYWMAWQFDLPEAGKGVVRAFRRAKCVYEAARFPLSTLSALPPLALGLDVRPPAADYQSADNYSTSTRTTINGVGSIEIGEDEPLRGALFETYVAQNLAGILGARWPEGRLSFWHVQGRHEVDFIIESGRETTAIEVKSAARWDDRDLRGLRTFLETASRAKAAILAHNGTEAVKLGDRLWALPLCLILA